MPDREKVLKGLERCKLYNKVNCDKCPYDYNGRGNGKSECTAELATDALALLKEQQEQIEQMNYIYGFVYGGQVKEIKKLVRCKECKHRDPEDHKCDYGHDIQWQLPRADDWFCSDGEQK